MKLKKGAKRLLMLLLVIIIVALVAAYLLLYDSKKPAKKVKVLNKIPEYGYELKDNKTEAYKEAFHQLEKILKEDPVDEEKYVKKIAEMFILDFYTLNDKLAKTDVGGADFVHQEAVVDFLEKAQDTMYKYLESNLYDERTQKLPTVKEVTIKSVEKSPFTYKEKVDDEALIVKASWEYTDTSTSNGYQTEATLTFVHEDKKISLVELQ